MTEQPPSASKEAMKLALMIPLSHPTDRRVQMLATGIDALIAQRVSAETERCATAIPENYKFSDYPDLQRMAENANHVFRGYIRHPAERPAPPQGRFPTAAQAEKMAYLSEGSPPARRLTQGEVNVMNRALRRSTRLIHEGELAPASTGEQPETPVRANLAHTAAVVDYTERALAVARDAVEGVPTDLLPCRSNSEAIAQAIAPDIDDALAAVASGHQAALLARLQEPDVREAIARSIARSHFARKQHYGVCTKEARLDHLVEQYWDQFISDADAAIARIGEMLTP